MTAEASLALLRAEILDDVGAIERLIGQLTALRARVAAAEIVSSP